MNSTAIPPALGETASCVLRVFGARPFHTDGDLLALAFTDASTIWSIEESGVARHWNATAQQQIAFHALDDPATLWALNPKAGLVAAGSDDLQIWDLESGAPIADWPAVSWVSALALSPTGHLLVTGHDNGMIRLWDPNRDNFLREFRGHSQAVSTLAFSADGRKLASSGEDKAIHLWDLATTRPVGTLLGHNDRIPALTWHPDGKRLLSAGWDTTVRVWDLATCEPIILLNAHAGQVLTMAVAPNGLLLASADSSNAVHIWDLAAYQPRYGVQGRTREVRCLAWAPDSRRLAAGGTDRVIHLWDTRQQTVEEQPIDPQASRTNLSLRSGGKQLLSLGPGTVLRNWNVTSGNAGPELADAGVLRAFASSPDGSWIAGARALPGEPETWHDPVSRRREPPARVLGLWNAETGTLHKYLEGQKPPITALAFAPDSRRLATAGFLGEDVWLWSVPDGRPALLIAEAADACAIQALAWHPDGKLLAVCGIDYMATGGSDGKTGLWDTASAEPVAWIPGGGVAVAFHPMGHQLAIASLTQTVLVWDISGTEAASSLELAGHLDAVTCVAYSPDGRLLATGGDDHTVRFWETETGLQRNQFELDTQIKSLSFTPDGLTLYTGNGNTSCYELDVGKLLAEGT